MIHTKIQEYFLQLHLQSGDITKNKISPTGTGYFESFHSLDKYAELGTYKASAVYKDEIIGIQLFDLVDEDTNITQNSSINQTQKIPSWAKNIFIWYGQDKISEDELLTAIEFLVNDGLIKIK